MLLQDLPDGSSHRQFPGSGTFDFAACAIDFRPPLAGIAQAFEPFSATVDDVVHVAECFDVIHNRWLAPESADLRIGRFGARRRALPFQGIEQAGLFTTHIAAPADVEIQLKAIAGPSNILAQVVAFVSLGYG